jgi:hypothetical protein
MMSPADTPLVAVVAGSATMRTNSLGGNVISLAGSDGNGYYYAHLSAYSPLAVEGHQFALPLTQFSPVDATRLLARPWNASRIYCRAPNDGFPIYATPTNDPQYVDADPKNAFFSSVNRVKGKPQIITKLSYLGGKLAQLSPKNETQTWVRCMNRAPPRRSLCLHAR